MPLFGKEDPRGGPEYPEIYPNPFESEPRPMSDIGTPLTVAPPTLHHHHLPQHVPAAGLGATARRADNALGLVFPPFQMHADGASAVVTSAPQAESLRAPSNHQDIRSREHTNQKCYSPRGQATPQSHVTANKALVAGCLQDTRLGGAMSNVSGSEKPKKTFTSRQKAHSYKRPPKARKNYGTENWLSPGEPEEWVDNGDALSTCADYAEHDKLLRAPLMRPVALPNDEV